MTDASQKLVVVIVYYNLPEITIDCIQSVIQSNYSPIEILLIDNGSEPDVKTEITRAFPWIQIVRINENQGFVGGFNRGIQEALNTRATDIFLLSNDTIVEPSTIPELLKSGWDVAVPMILFFDYPEIIQSAGAHWRKFPPSVKLTGFRRPNAPEYNIPKLIPYAMGCALMVKREVLEHVGGFDLEFENYNEDYDFCFRVTAASYQIGYVPSAKIYHKDSMTLGRDPKRRRWYIGRNTVLFYLKDNRFPTWYLWSFMFWLLLREAIKGNFSHLPDYYQGFLDGFRFLRNKSKV